MICRVAVLRRGRNTNFQAKFRGLSGPSGCVLVRTLRSIRFCRGQFCFLELFSYECALSSSCSPHWTMSNGGSNVVKIKFKLNSTSRRREIKAQFQGRHRRRDSGKLPGSGHHETTSCARRGDRGPDVRGLAGRPAIARETVARLRANAPGRGLPDSLVSPKFRERATRCIPVPRISYRVK